MIRIRVVHSTSFLLSRDRIAQVQDIFRHSFPSLAKYADTIPSLLYDPLRHGYSSALLVAEAALGRVDAFALVLHFPATQTCFLDFIATRPGVHGNGVGSALYEAVREYAQGLNATALYLEVQPDLSELTPDAGELDEARQRIRFYERYGVRAVENRAYSLPVGDPSTTALLLYDGLGQTEPLAKTAIQAAIEMIFARRFRQVTNPDYVHQILEAFDDPVRFRPMRYVKAIHQTRRSPHALSSQLYACVFTAKHELHHVRERGYFERPIRAEAIQETVNTLGMFASLAPREHRDTWLMAVHEPSFVHYLRTVCTTLKQPRPVYPDTFPIRRLAQRPKELAVQAGYYCLDSGTPLYPNAYRAARAAVDTALTAADEIFSGRRLAYAVCRPPGHHAGKRFYGGFCYFNNAAIAAHYFSTEAKVAILDLDYHHGNGTQDIFYDRADVLTLSIHGHPDYSYPYFSGYKDETGTGAGLAANHNFPLPPKTQEKQYLSALDRALDIMARWKPDVIVVGLGFDILKGDPTGTFMLGPDIFSDIGQRLISLSRPLLIIQEGGYNVRNIRRGTELFFNGCRAAEASSTAASSTAASLTAASLTASWPPAKSRAR